MSESDALAYLLNAAPNFGAAILARDASEATVLWTVYLIDGRPRSHHLRLRLVGDRVAVAEAGDRLLPASCPERHINGDGAFCLGWNDPLDSAVPDAAWATAWWQRLWAFLCLQARAEKLRYWPGPAWPHGDAASHQQQAEEAAGSLSPALKDALENGALRMRRLTRSSRKGEPIFQLLQGDDVLWPFWGDPLRPINKQRACPCPHGDIKRHRRLKTCGNHAGALQTLATALMNRDLEEARFWAGLKAGVCCGTMDGCALAPRQQHMTAAKAP